ncbi:MAG: type II/IV secretion system protein [Rubrivivax sp.]|nr:type II/IV secretion system protein [Rubrivivax sp.]
MTRVAQQQGSALGASGHAAPIASEPALGGELLDWVRAVAKGGQQPLPELARRLDVALPVATRVLAEAVGFGWISPAQLQGRRHAGDIVPLADARRMNVAVLRDEPGLQVATGDNEAVRTPRGSACVCVLDDPFDAAKQLRLQHAAGGVVRYALAAPELISAFLSEESGRSSAVDLLPADGSPTAAHPGGAPAAELALSLESVADAQSAAARRVQSILLDAQNLAASDVHFERTPTGLSVRYRLDGVLTDPKRLPGRELAGQMVSCIKVWASLDIAEHRLPQDGSFSVQVEGRKVDLRVSVMPGIHGEDVVVRILDKRSLVGASQSLRLEALGFDSATLAQLRRLLDEPYGMLLVTGPTGSGKTTTLYAALTEIHSIRDKVVTIEDPVEYHLPDVLQVPVNEKQKLTFELGLRSILRHDPDIIMVGEIRDRQTAEIAVQSALTGHLVLSTVHANNVFGVFDRLTHMGLDNHALVAAINGVWAQRLVRVICEHCAQATQSDEALLERMGLTPDAVSGWHQRKGLGCSSCRQTGYRGRRAIAEVLRMDGAVRERLLAREPMEQVRDFVLQRHGMRPMLQCGLDLVRDGVTTLEEVRRVATLD